MLLPRGHPALLVVAVGAIVALGSALVFRPALVTVLVVVGFLHVEALVLMYLAFRHKPADPERERTEQLRAELDELRSGL